MNALVRRKTAGSPSEEFFVREVKPEPRRRTKRLARSRVIPAVLIAGAAIAFLLPNAGATAMGPKAFYGSYSNGLPTSSNFFPIGVWYQDPSGGNVPAQYADQAQAFKAMGITSSSASARRTASPGRRTTVPTRVRWLLRRPPAST